MEAIHLHDKSRHSEVFAIDILDNLGGIHLRDAPTDSFSCLEICEYKGIRLTLWSLIMCIYTK